MTYTQADHDHADRMMNTIRSIETHQDKPMVSLDALHDYALDWATHKFNDKLDLPPTFFMSHKSGHLRIFQVMWRNEDEKHAMVHGLGRLMRLMDIDKYSLAVESWALESKGDPATTKPPKGSIAGLPGTIEVVMTTTSSVDHTIMTAHKIVRKGWQVTLEKHWNLDSRTGEEKVQGTMSSLLKPEPDDAKFAMKMMEQFEAFKQSQGRKR